MTASARPAPPIITLTTDFGLEDWYVAAMKAVLLQHCPAARLIDVTHRIHPGDVLCGSFCVERAVAAFPARTVHLAVVDPGVGSDRRMLIGSINQQWIVCPDNGLITWTCRRYPGVQVMELIWRPQHTSATFHGRDIMGPAAAMLATGRPPADLARPMVSPVLLNVTLTQSGEPAVVIHCDRFGNATTNIPEEALRLTPNAQVEVHGRTLGPVRQTYSDVPPGHPLALIGSSGLLEIAVRDGSAAALLGLHPGDAVVIDSHPGNG